MPNASARQLTDGKVSKPEPRALVGSGSGDVRCRPAFATHGSWDLGGSYDDIAVVLAPRPEGGVRAGAIALGASWAGDLNGAAASQKLQPNRSGSNAISRFEPGHQGGELRRMHGEVFGGDGDLLR